MIGRSVRHGCGRPSLAAVALLPTMLLALAAGRDMPSAAAQGPRKPSAAKQRTKRLTTEQESRALAFVKRHQPALIELLLYLKENRRREYDRALAELYRTSQRLEQAKRRQPKRYRLELEAWKVQSQIQLLVARLVMSDDPHDRQTLREALRRQHQLRIELLELERRRLAERLDRIDATLESLRSKGEARLERSMQQLLRKARRMQKENNGRRRKTE